MSQTVSDAAAKYAPKPPKAVAQASADIDAMINAQRQPPPAQGQEPGAGQPDKVPLATPQAPGQVPPVQATPPAAPPAPAQEETAEQRARSAEGRLQLAAERERQMLDRLNQLENLVANMRAAGATEPPAPGTTPPAPKPRLVTNEEETEYGKEMLDVVAKRAREEFNPELDGLRMELSMLKTRIDGTSQVLRTTQQQTVYQVLDSQVPTWRTINNSPDFLAWLAAIDPFAGRSRQELLTEAFTRQDANRVLRFFQGFAEATGTPPAQPGSVAATPPATGNPTRPTLEELAAPGGARSAPQSPLPPEKPTYTSAQVAKFMADKRTGKWKGREADADAIERDIFQAQHEGRFLG